MFYSNYVQQEDNFRYFLLPGFFFKHIDMESRHCLICKIDALFSLFYAVF